MLTTEKIYQVADLIKFGPILERAGLKRESFYVMMSQRRSRKRTRDFTPEESAAISRELRALLSRIEDAIR